MMINVCVFSLQVICCPTSQILSANKVGWVALNKTLRGHFEDVILKLLFFDRIRFSLIQFSL